MVEYKIYWEGHGQYLGGDQMSLHHRMSLLLQSLPLSRVTVCFESAVGGGGRGLPDEHGERVFW